MRPIEEIAAERRRQIESEGYNSTHDDAHSHGEIARAAAAYALASTIEDRRRHPHADYFVKWRGGRHTIFAELWPWGWHDFNPKNRRADLIRAGALIVAEIERLDRSAPCEYCDGGKRTALPGNACENCMNTGLAHPELSQSR